MDESAPSSLESNTEALIEMGMNHETQELFFENLSIFQSIPQFPFALLKIISKQEASIPFRINAISLLRPLLNTIDNSLINDFWKEADECLFYALQIPYSDLVKEIAVLASEIYQKFHERTTLTIFPFLNVKLVETIQIPEFVPNALIFALDFARINRHSIFSDFASFLPNFAIGEYSEITIELASLLTIHWALFEETMIPVIFENLEELSINSIKYTCILVGNILQYDRPQILIDFIIHCIQNENDMIVFSAVDSIYKNQMITYQEDLILSLFKRIGNDANLCECNVSTICLSELKRRYLDSRTQCHPYLMNKINESFQSENANEIRCAIRCFSILKIENSEDIEKAMNLLTNFLGSEFCCDASYSMTRITKKHPNLFPRVFEVVFQVLRSDSTEVRYQIFNFLSYLSIKIEPMLTNEIKGQIHSEPYMGILLEMIQNAEISYEEFLEVLRLIGSFCGLVQSFNGDNFNLLVQITLEILSKNSELAVECLVILSSIINKQKEAFLQLYEVSYPIVLSIIEQCKDDENALKYSLNFFSKAVEGSYKFEFLSDEFNKSINQVCEFGFACINPSSSFVIQKAGWFFYYHIILYDSELFDKYKEPIIQNLINVNCPTNLFIIGIKCQLALVFIDRYEQILNTDIKFQLINVCYRGLLENEWDGSIDRQMCFLCLLKLTLITPEFNIDSKTMSDIFSLMEYHDDYIKDQRMFTEISKCLEALIQNENEDSQKEEPV